MALSTTSDSNSTDKSSAQDSKAAPADDAAEEADETTAEENLEMLQAVVQTALQLAFDAGSDFSDVSGVSLVEDPSSGDVTVTLVDSNGKSVDSVVKASDINDYLVSEDPEDGADA